MDHRTAAAFEAVLQRIKNEFQEKLSRGAATHHQRIADKLENIGDRTDSANVPARWLPPGGSGGHRAGTDFFTGGMFDDQIREKIQRQHRMRQVAEPMLQTMIDGQFPGHSIKLRPPDPVNPYDHPHGQFYVGAGRFEHLVGDIIDKESGQQLGRMYMAVGDTPERPVLPLGYRLETSKSAPR